MITTSTLPRILLLSDIFPPKTGGSGRWFWEIYSRLPRDRVLIVTGVDGRAAEFDPTHDLRIHRWPLAMATRGVRSFGNFGQYCANAWRLRRLVKREAIDVIHAGRNLPEGFIAYLVRKATGTPYWCYVHGEDIGIAATSRELAWMSRRVFRGATRLVANSEQTRTSLLTDWQLPGEKVSLLYPGVDCTRFVPAPSDEIARKSLGWHGRDVILTVGRLQKRKGHDMLIRALPAIAVRHPQALYAIIGAGDELPVLRSLAVHEGVVERVQFLGECDDDRLIQCYQQCDLFVLPNRAVGRDVEGFGMVLLEAQACGKPVIAGASGGTAETMRVPETGLLIDCHAPASLSAAIVALLADCNLRRTMGSAGRQFVSERFDWQALTVQAANIFAH